MNKLLYQFIETAKSEPKSEELLLIKLMEEIGEVSEAYLSSKHPAMNKDKNLTLEDYQEELVDTLLVTATLLFKSEISREDFEDLCKRKISKWQSKQ